MIQRMEFIKKLLVPLDMIYVLFDRTVLYGTVPDTKEERIINLYLPVRYGTCTVE